LGAVRQSVQRQADGSDLAKVTPESRPGAALGNSCVGRNLGRCGTVQP